MTAELTQEEAEILIAVLTFAENEAEMHNPAMAGALRVLRPWRSALLHAYLRERLNPPVTADAIDPAEIARLNDA